MDMEQTPQERARNGQVLSSRHHSSEPARPPASAWDSYFDDVEAYIEKMEQADVTEQFHRILDRAGHRTPSHDDVPVAGVPRFGEASPEFSSPGLAEVVDGTRERLAELQDRLTKLQGHYQDLLAKAAAARADVEQSRREAIRIRAGADPDAENTVGTLVSLDGAAGKARAEAAHIQAEARRIKAEAEAFASEERAKAWEEAGHVREAADAYVKEAAGFCDIIFAEAHASVGDHPALGVRVEEDRIDSASASSPIDRDLAGRHPAVLRAPDVDPMAPPPGAANLTIQTLELYRDDSHLGQRRSRDAAESGYEVFLDGDAAASSHRHHALCENAGKIPWEEISESVPAARRPIRILSPMAGLWGTLSILGIAAAYVAAPLNSVILAAITCTYIVVATTVITVTAKSRSLLWPRRFGERQRGRRSAAGPRLE